MTRPNFIACVGPKHLPSHLVVPAAEHAIKINPANAPAVQRLPHLAAFGEPPVLSKEHLAVLTSKYWGSAGKTFTVKFLDKASADLQKKILEHMNAWAQWANVHFARTTGAAMVRITLTPGDGYWSYLGTDILQIPASEPTMNLDSFSLSTEDFEYRRVVRHETGHTLGFPHEHTRKEIIDRLDPAKTEAYMLRTYGWSKADTDQQVLTPVSESELIGTPHADQDSIMAYQLPAECTKDGQPVRGGVDIDALDQGLAAKLYPLQTAPPPPPAGGTRTIVVTGASKVTVDGKTI